MNFDRLHAYIELLRKQKQEREIFMAHGMDSDSVDELFRADYRQLYHDVEFYRHLERYIGMDSDISAEGDSQLDTMDEIESPVLYEALRSLRPFELEIVLRHSVKGESLKAMSDERNEPYSTIQSIYIRAIKKLRKFFF